jgi:hypothetical protein
MDSLTNEDIQTAYKNFESFNKCNIEVCPEPTITFEINEEVSLGGLRNVIVKEILHNGKAYRLEYLRSERDKPLSLRTDCWWWFNVDKLNAKNKDLNESLFKDPLPGNLQSIEIETLKHKMSSGGIVFNPVYQRGYVWTDRNKVDLIDSIFNNVQIGSIIGCRNQGFNHKDSEKTVEYMNIDQQLITINKKVDYTFSVIDGQQRITTLWQFFTNQFSYKNKFWKDLSFFDQINFQRTLISARMIDEEGLTEKQTLEVFLMVNKGVPQDIKHLKNIEEMLEKY